MSNPVTELEEPSLEPRKPLTEVKAKCRAKGMLFFQNLAEKSFRITAPLEDLSQGTKGLVTLEEKGIPKSFSLQFVVPRVFHPIAPHDEQQYREKNFRSAQTETLVEGIAGRAQDRNK